MMIGYYIGIGSDGTGTGISGGYTPNLDFSNENNSQYIALF